MRFIIDSLTHQPDDQFRLDQQPPKEELFQKHAGIARKYETETKNREGEEIAT